LHQGRAGRPQFDDSGRAVILVHAPKKNFYRKFLYQPFPVESHLRDALHNHFNAEVATGTIGSVQDAVDYLTWTYVRPATRYLLVLSQTFYLYSLTHLLTHSPTHSLTHSSSTRFHSRLCSLQHTHTRYFFRRLLANPSYYHLEDTSPEAVRAYLQALSEGVLGDLEAAGCVEMASPESSEGGCLVTPTTLGLVASYYYLEHSSVGMFADALGAGNAALPALAQLLADAHEYVELPVAPLTSAFSFFDLLTTNSRLVSLSLRYLLLSTRYDELPVRHNEELLNEQLAAAVPWPADALAMDSAHTKAFLLLQAHFTRTALPISDYINDTKSVLDQVRTNQCCLRLLFAHD
jgi:activating signal cointegrator complex subunit 3